MVASNIKQITTAIENLKGFMRILDSKNTTLLPSSTFSPENGAGFGEECSLKLVG